MIELDDQPNNEAKIHLEMLNTVNDDNKVFVTTDGERIPLRPDARVVIYMQTMEKLSPAVVSRMGVVNLA